MSLFLPNLDCTIVHSTGHDVYGQVLVGASYPERCAIIELKSVAVKTPVRADSSASRGAAEELQIKAEILLTASTVAKMEDLILINGLSLRIDSMFPRHSIEGVLDHYQITAIEWGA